MRHLVSATIAACLLTGAASAAHAADCHFTPYSFQFGVDASTQMTVKSGKVCGSNINYRGGGASQISVQQPAENGTVLTPTPTRWEYVSKKGFTGTDHFIVGVTGESMGRYVYRGTTQIAVDVTVTP